MGFFLHALEKHPRFLFVESHPQCSRYTSGLISVSVSSTTVIFFHIKLGENSFLFVLCILL